MQQLTLEEEVEEEDKGFLNQLIRVLEQVEMVVQE
jgi:hypothetical protein